jgi:hypothetical protein
MTRARGLLSQNALKLKHALKHRRVPFCWLVLFIVGFFMLVWWVLRR